MQQTRSLSIPPQVEGLLKAALQRVLREVGHLVIALLQHWLEKQLGQPDGAGGDGGGEAGDTGQKSPTGEDDEEPHSPLPSPLPIEADEEPGRGEDEVTGSGDGGSSVPLPVPQAPQAELTLAADQPRRAELEEGSLLAGIGTPLTGPVPGFAPEPASDSREPDPSLVDGTGDDMRWPALVTGEVIPNRVDHTPRAAAASPADSPQGAAPTAPTTDNERAQETAARGECPEPAVRVVRKASGLVSMEAQPSSGPGATLVAEGRKGRSLPQVASAERGAVPFPVPTLPDLPARETPLPSPRVVRPEAPGLAEGGAGVRPLLPPLMDAEALVAREVDAALQQRVADAQFVTVEMLEEFYRRQRREEMTQALF